MQTLSRQSALGTAFGAFILAGFGTLWLLLGVGAMGQLGWPKALACAVPGIAIASMAVRLKQHARTLPQGSWTVAENARSKRLFKLANLGQGIAIVLAGIVLNRLHRPGLEAPVIGIIVGLHFFPLAVGFQHKQHNLTGALLVVWNLGCMILLTNAQVPGISAVGNGVILLLSIAATLTLALNRARCSQPALQTAG